ncbi:MAG: DNA primase [Spirochaetales bacterium]|nr:DNA primase [Spirochaetales bacterium]
MSRNVRDEINNKLSIVDVVEKYLTLKRQGTRYIGLCPFHNEKTPSFSVDPANNLFYCFGCHKGGTIFDFIMEIENVGYGEALRILAEKAGVALDSNMDHNSEGYKNKQALKELYKRVSSSFTYILNNKEEASVAREYLLTRGVTKEISELFGIGWAPEDRSWLLKFLRSKGYSDNFLKESGLFSKRGLGSPLFSGRIMFPLKSQSGDIIGFSGRTLKDLGPKYINSPETEIFYKKRNLYGLSDAVKGIREKGYFILCEGQMDVIAYHQAGMNNAVAPLGTAYTEDQARLLKRYAEKAVISFDGDAAGQKAMMKAVQICEKLEIRTKIAIFEKNDDPSDLLRNKGPEALQNVLKSTINSFDYILENALNLYGTRTPDSKEAIIQQMSIYLNSIVSNVRKEGYIKEISEKIGVGTSSIVTDLKRGQRHSVIREQKEESPKPKQIKEEITLELFLMIAVIVNREKFAYVRSKIDINDLEEKRAKEIFIALEECYRNEETGFDSILRKLSDENLISLLSSKITSEEYSTNSDELIVDSVKNLKRRNLLKKRAELERKLGSFMNAGNSDISNEMELLSEKIFIDNEIEKLRLGK